jgi:transposase
MPQNFIDCDREQAFLMPPSLRDWLPEDHLAWFVIESVKQLDLDAFYASYRPDGHGRAAYEPSMMVSLLLFAYSTKERSSRGIERHCRQDIAYRVITANQVPDHATIARFVSRHEAALAGLFASVLGLCEKAGLVRSGVVAIDGTKMHANASRDSNVDYDRVAREVIAEAIAIDQAEDEVHGDARGDELPAELSTDAGRREWLARELAKQRAGDGEESETEPDVDAGDEFDVERIVARARGRRGWLREAKRQLDRERWRDASPVPRSRSERLLEAGRRLDDELAAERRGNKAYERYRAAGRDKHGRRFSTPPKPYQPPATPQGEVNLTDPDARVMRAFRGYVQGYNAQAAVNESQIVLAAEITVDTGDFSHLQPMITAVVRELEQAGIEETPGVAVADAGYWNEEHMDEVTAEHGIQVLIRPDASKRDAPRPGWTGGRFDWMRRVLSSELGEELYRKRKQTVEPVFGHTKHNRQFGRFHRRGRVAVRTEWRLIMTTHNLTKLHRHQLAAAGP